jgi:hypothetical protein
MTAAAKKEDAQERRTNQQLSLILLAFEAARWQIIIITLNLSHYLW